MNRAIHRLRLFFCFFSGEDDFIIRKCKPRIQLSFALIGFFVLLVFIGCWVSAALFMTHIFDGGRWISIPTGIIWAMLVTNLYLLLLYTVSPSLLPISRKKKIRKGDKIIKVLVESKAEEIHPLLRFSLFVRIAFIVLLAIIIAQPFNVFLFSPSFEESDLYAKAIREILSKNPLSWIISILSCCIFLLPIYFKYQVRSLSKRYFNNDFSNENSDKGILHLREQLIKPTDYNNLSRQILSLNINLIRTSDFYFQKTLLEYRIILEEYEKFKKDYCNIWIEKSKHNNRQTWNKLMPFLDTLEKINPEIKQQIELGLKNELQAEEISKYEYWADPPFRTQHKTSIRKISSEEELLKTFYQE